MNTKNNLSRKQVTLFIVLTYLFSLVSYPLLRSSSSALFYEHYTANEYSLATFIGVIFLMGLIGLSNKLQMTLGIQKLFLGFCFLTIILLSGAFVGLKSGIPSFAYGIFALKEAYIVLLVHLSLAYANAFYSLDELKKYIGPIGAIGSIGGILGGQLTSYLAKDLGTETVFFTSFLFIALSGLCFYKTRGTVIAGLNINKSITPLKAVRGVKKYVILIGVVVALSQFVIYLADLQFNFVFEEMVKAKDERSAYLGDFYTVINIVSLVMQFVVLPILLTKISLRGIFIFVPTLYFILVLAGASYGTTSLMVISTVFITMKGTDYSLFAAAKDIMYHPLLSLQKFGAKYITDMFVYRSSKALIAFIMANVMIKESGLMTTIQLVFLAGWIVAVLYLFEEQKKLNK